MSQLNDEERHGNVAGLNVVVIGAGLMGHSIAGVFAAAGASVTVHDANSGVLQQVPERIAKQFETTGRDVEAAGRVRLVDALDEVGPEAHLVIEAVPEILDLKQELFARLSALLPDAVLATNTSVFKISDVARDAIHPHRVVGTHWWNPPHLIPLVEVVAGEHTDSGTTEWMIDILAQAGKVPVHVRKDVPGFIGNRIQHAMWREAISLVEAGVCDAETVDLVVRNSFGLRLPAMGPIENADYVGLDLTAAVHNYLFPSLNHDDHASPLITRLIEEGNLGAKTGSGMLGWEEGKRAEATTRLERHLIETRRGTST